MKLKAWISFIICTLALSACKTVTQPTTPETQQTPTPPSEAVWEKSKKQLTAINNWQLEGKIAVQAPHDSGSATVNWTERHGQYVMSLLGPLGSHSLELRGRPGFVTLKNAEGQQVKASSPEELLRRQWGWNLPISDLKYWIRGLPVPGLKADSHFDANNRLTSLSQAGWHIQYLDYMKVQDRSLPSRLTISSAAIKTKIVIYHWNIS